MTVDDTKMGYEAPAVVDLGTLVQITRGNDNQGTTDPPGPGESSGKT